MRTFDSPYFLWDYDLTDNEVRAILRGKDEVQKLWIVGRLIESARYEDVWKYISLAELQELFPKLQLKPQVRAVWEFALGIWNSGARRGR